MLLSTYTKWKYHITISSLQTFFVTKIITLSWVISVQLLNKVNNLKNSSTILFAKWIKHILLLKYSVYLSQSLKTLTLVFPIFFLLVSQFFNWCLGGNYLSMVSIIHPMTGNSSYYFRIQMLSFRRQNIRHILNIGILYMVSDFLYL